jgi:hypothetical protein
MAVAFIAFVFALSSLLALTSQPRPAKPAPPALADAGIAKGDVQRTIRTIPIVPQPPLFKTMWPAAATAPIVTAQNDEQDAPTGDTLEQKRKRWLKNTYDPVAPAPAPAAVPESTPTVIAEKRWHWSDRDVCTRHGLHKISIHNGKGWRCK